MADDFITRLEGFWGRHKRPVGLLIRPVVSKMPGIVQKYDDPFLPFGKAVIDATRDLVCAYVFDLPAYLAIGAAGAIALERTLAYARGEAITILHGSFADPQFAGLLDENSFGADALTIADEMHLDDFLGRADRGVFVVRAGARQNPHPVSDAGVYWLGSNELTILNHQAELLALKVAGDSVVYASKGESYQADIRAVLEQMP